MISAAEAATKREGFGCRALSRSAFSAQLFRVIFCNFSAKRGEVTDKESIRCQSAAQVDNTEHCYHTRLGKVKSPISQLYNFACAPAPEREIVPPLFRIRFSKGGGDAFYTDTSRQRRDVARPACGHSQVG